MMERELSRRSSDSSSGLRRNNVFNLRRRFSDQSLTGGSKPMASRADYIRDPNDNTHEGSPKMIMDHRVRRWSEQIIDHSSDGHVPIIGSPGRHQPVIMPRGTPPGCQSELEADRAMIQNARRLSGSKLSRQRNGDGQEVPPRARSLHVRKSPVQVIDSDTSYGNKPIQGLSRRASAPPVRPSDSMGLSRRSSAPVVAQHSGARLPRAQLAEPRRFSECSSTSSRGARNPANEDIYKVPPSQVQSIDEWTNAEDDRGSRRKHPKPGSSSHVKDRYLDIPRQGSPRTASDRHRRQHHDGSSPYREQNNNRDKTDWEHYQDRLRNMSPRQQRRDRHHRDESPYRDHQRGRRPEGSPYLDRKDYYDRDVSPYSRDRGGRYRDHSPYDDQNMEVSPYREHYLDRHRRSSPDREHYSDRHRNVSPQREYRSQRLRDVSPQRDRYAEYPRGGSPMPDRYGPQAREGSPYEDHRRPRQDRSPYRDQYDEEQGLPMQNGRSAGGGGVVLRPKQEKTDKSKCVKARKSFIDRLFGPKHKDKESKKDKKKGKANRRGVSDQIYPDMHPALHSTAALGQEAPHGFEAQEVRLGLVEEDSEGGRSDPDLTEDEAGDTKENRPPHGSNSSAEEGARAISGRPDYSDDDSHRDNNNRSMTEDDWNRLIDDVENDMAFPDPPEPEVDYHDEDGENDAPVNGMARIIQPALGSLEDLPKHLKPASSTENLVEPKKLPNPVINSKLHQDLHREMEANKRMGVNVLMQKTELKKEFERRQDVKKKKEREEYDKQKKTEIQKRLEEQKQKYDELEKGEKKEAPAEEPDAGAMSEFQRMRSKIYSNKTS